MDLEAGLISKIESKKDLLRLLDTQITVEFFSLEVNKSVYKEILGHYKSYGVVPSREVIGTVFPDFKFVESEEPLDFFIDAIKKRHKKNIVSQGIAEAIQLIKSDVDAAETKLQQTLFRAKKEVTSGFDVDIRNSGEDRKEDYLSKKEYGGIDGVSSGWNGLDDLTCGFHPGEFYCLIGVPKSGKGVRLEEDLPTPQGFKKAKDVIVGDYLFGSDGKPVRVTGVSDVHHLPCYNITFNDKVSIVTDSEHQWTVYERKNSKRVERVISTLEMFKQGVWIDDIVRRTRFAIPLAKPIEYEEQDLLVHPYILGLWLGDGTSREASISVGELDLEAVVNKIHSLGVPTTIYKNRSVYTVRLTDGNRKVQHGISIQAKLKKLGVINNKHIPSNYLSCSVSQRLDLLRGLMDSDGCSYKKVNAFYNNNVDLCRGVVELIHSLGGRGKIFPKVTKLNGKTYNSYQVIFQLPMSAFYLKRKQSSERLLGKRPYRYIIDIQEVSSEPTVCFTVDSEDSLYIASKSYIVTHNSWLLSHIAHYVWCKERVPTLVLTREMSPAQMRKRFDAIHCGLPYSLLRKGLLSKSQEEKYFQYLDEIKNDDVPFIFLGYSLTDSASPTVSSIIPKVERYLSDGGMLFIDGLYMLDDDSGEKDWRGVTNIARDIKGMSQRYPISTFVTTQAQIQGKGYIPDMENIAYAKYIAQYVDGLLSTSRSPEDRMADMAWIHMIAQREGDVGEFPINFAFDPIDFSQKQIRTIQDDEDEYEI